MAKEKREKIVFSVGGSLIVPNGGIDIDFLARFNTFVREFLRENPLRQLFIVAGGGSIARHYRDAGKSVLGHELTADDMDWLGVHATRLNAHLLRTIFRDIAHPYIIKHYDIIRKVHEPVAIAAGWKPGWSTDYDSILLCEDYDIDTVINLTNIERVYDKDPREHADAKPFDRMTWQEFRALVGDAWTPGMNAPFDPVAAKRAQELGVTVAIMKGGDFDNLKKYFTKEEFVGTVIKN